MVAVIGDERQAPWRAAGDRSRILPATGNAGRLDTRRQYNCCYGKLKAILALEIPPADSDRCAAKSPARKARAGPSLLYFTFARSSCGGRRRYRPFRRRPIRATDKAPATPTPSVAGSGTAAIAGGGPVYSCCQTKKSAPSETPSLLVSPAAVEP
jgi:hypothetical protein